MNLSETLERMSGKELVELFNDCCEEGAEVKRFRNKEAAVARILTTICTDSLAQYLSHFVVVEDDNVGCAVCEEEYDDDEDEGKNKMKFQKSIPNFLTKVAEAMEIAGAGVTDTDVVEEHHTTPNPCRCAFTHTAAPDAPTTTTKNEILEIKQELEALENFWYERAHKPVSSWDVAANDAARRYAEGQFSAFRLILKTLFGDEKFSLRQWIEIEGPDGVDWDWKGEEK
jgi:hypothetical protein